MELIFCGTLLGTYSEIDIDDDGNKIYFDFVPHSNLCSEEVSGTMVMDIEKGLLVINTEDDEYFIQLIALEYSFASYNCPAISLYERKDNE
jgi:hypothetical protein